MKLNYEFMHIHRKRYGEEVESIRNRYPPIPVVPITNKTQRILNQSPAQTGGSRKPRIQHNAETCLKAYLAVPTFNRNSKVYEPNSVAKFFRIYDGLWEVEKDKSQLRELYAKAREENGFTSSEKLVKPHQASYYGLDSGIHEMVDKIGKRPRTEDKDK